MALLVAVLIALSCSSYSLAQVNVGEALAAVLEKQDTLRTNLRLDAMETSISSLTSMIIDLKHSLYEMKGELFNEMKDLKLEMKGLKLAFNSWFEGLAAKLILLLIGGGGILISTVLVLVFRNPNKVGLIWGTTL